MEVPPWENHEKTSGSTGSCKGTKPGRLTCKRIYFRPPRYQIINLICVLPSPLNHWQENYLETNFNYKMKINLDMRPMKGEVLGDWGAVA